MRIHLKVKLCTLAAEARIIRKLEARRANAGKKGDDPVRASLSAHRREVVRRAARSTCLAYGFLRGKAYEAMEEKTFSSPDWKAVEKMVNQYSAGDADQRDIAQRFSEWKSGAKVSVNTRKVARPERAHKTREEWEAEKQAIERASA